MVLVVAGLMVAVGLTTRGGSELPAALVIGKGVVFMGQWVTAEHCSCPPGCSVPGAKVRLGGWEAKTKSVLSLTPLPSTSLHLPSAIPCLLISNCELFLEVPGGCLYTHFLMSSPVSNQWYC